MDAIEFLKAKNRICKKYDCYTCVLGNEEGGCQAGAVYNQILTEEQVVANVETWLVEHPIKSRKSEFLKMFPNAKVGNSNAIEICPKIIDTTLGRYCDSEKRCCDCLKEYWLAEVD